MNNTELERLKTNEAARAKRWRTHNDGNTNENHPAIFIIVQIKTFFYSLLQLLELYNLIFRAAHTWGLRRSRIQCKLCIWKFNNIQFLISPLARCNWLKIIEKFANALERSGRLGRGKSLNSKTESHPSIEKPLWKISRSCVEINFHEMQCRQSSILSDTIIDLGRKNLLIRSLWNSNFTHLGETSRKQNVRRNHSSHIDS